VRFEIWAGSKQIRSLPAAPYKPSFWTTSFTWLATDANRNLVVRAYVVVASQVKLTLTYPVRLGPKTKTVTVAREVIATGYHAGATASGHVERPYDFTFGAIASPQSQLVTLNWTISCTKGTNVATIHGTTTQSAAASAVVKPPVPRSSMCAVDVTASLSGSGSLTLDTFARVLAAP
jgi:hypothetical protein